MQTFSDRPKWTIAVNDGRQLKIVADLVLIRDAAGSR